MTLVSIIIPTFNEEEYIANCLISIQNQNFTDYEIIIIDGGSNDKTLEIIPLFKKVRLLFQTEIKSPGPSKNLGVEKAEGDIIIFLDADEVIEGNFISKLIAPILNNECFATVPYHFENNQKIEFSPKVFRAIRKDKFPGFDEKKGYADDQVDINFEIRKVDVPLFHLVKKTLRKSYLKGKWIGSSFEYNEKNSFGSKLLYKMGYIVGLFGGKR